ncbi:MAG: 2-C-methyl-D-erythritol 2,4-cyclodiphosphate synthase [Firmicutes bacterium]|nr:2-C-methyl-D-erythritol 2,4-cyclodiphosphate synthase [Bacillota bacterium]
MGRHGRRRPGGARRGNGEGGTGRLLQRQDHHGGGPAPGRSTPPRPCGVWRAVNLRVGIGYDVHRLVAGRPLVLGGVTIPHPLGLSGHSDADVLVHAVMDALLGAAGLGDIGRLFPDTDPAYRGASSLELLRRVRHLLTQRGWQVVNVDAVVVAQEPRLAPYVPLMEDAMARALELEGGRVHVKATTTEGLGFSGRREGMAACATCLLVRNG